MSISINNSDNNNDLIKNNFKLLYENFQGHKNNSDIFVITSWVKHSKGKYKPFVHNENLKFNKYNFSVKAIFNDLVYTEKNLCLKLKIISIIDSEIPTIKPNDYIIIKINSKVLQNPMSYVSYVFTSCYDIAQVKNNTIKLFDYIDGMDVDNINYLTMHQDDDSDPNYFDLEELKEQVDFKMKKDLEQLDIIKGWIYERKDIFEIIKELKKYIRDLENY